jgi:hypothetical protein
MAPEQCGVDGTDGISPATDVWGVGVTVGDGVRGHHGPAPVPVRQPRGSGPERFPQLTHDPARIRPRRRSAR